MLPQNIIETAPHTAFTPDDWALIKNWPSMLRQIEARKVEGFNLTKMVVNGASLVGAGEKRRPLMVQARISYDTPDGASSSYHVNFMPDAATLLVVFRVSAQEVMHPNAAPPVSVDDHYVLMIKQARYGMKAAAALEIPGGLLDDNGGPNFTNWESPAAGALREFTQEGISDENRGIFPVIAKDQIQPLGVSASHPGLTDEQHQFFTEIDMTRDAFAALKSKIDGTQAGNAHEQESTRVTILPFKDAFFETVRRPACGWSFVILARYADKRGLMTLSA